MITYGGIVWSGAMDTTKLRALLDRVQRLVCVCITGAMKTAPTRALERLCGLEALHLFIQKEAARAAHRLAGLNMLITDSAESWGPLKFVVPERTGNSLKTLTSRRMETPDLQMDLKT